MKRSDVDAQHVLELAESWQADKMLRPGVLEALVAEGVPEKVAYAKVMQLVSQGYLEYGTTPYYAWPTGKTLPS